MYQARRNDDQIQEHTCHNHDNALSVEATKITKETDMRFLWFGILVIRHKQRTRQMSRFLIYNQQWGDFLPFIIIDKYEMPQNNLISYSYHSHIAFYSK